METGCTHTPNGYLRKHVAICTPSPSSLMFVRTADRPRHLLAAGSEMRAVEIEFRARCTN